MDGVKERGAKNDGPHTKFALCTDLRTERTRLGSSLKHTAHTSNLQPSQRLMLLNQTSTQPGSVVGAAQL